MILLIVSILVTLILVGGISVIIYHLQKKIRHPKKKLYFLSLLGIGGMLLLLFGCFTKV